MTVNENEIVQFYWKTVEQSIWLNKTYLVYQEHGHDGKASISLCYFPVCLTVMEIWDE